MRFGYVAIDAMGEERRGSLDADGLVSAVEELQRRDLRAYRLQPEPSEDAPRLPREVDAFSWFNRSLASLCQAGVPASRSIRELSRGMARPHLRDALQRVVDSLEEGRSLPEAVEAEAAAFPRFYAALVRAGTAAGNLPRMLLLAARSNDVSRIARRAMVRALVYPAASAGIVLLGTSLFLGLLLPRLADLYAANDIVPSEPLSILIRLCGSPAAAAGTLIGLLVVCVALGWAAFRTARGEALLLRVPFLGPLLRSASQARFLDTFSALLEGRVRTGDALSVAIASSGSRLLAEEGGRMARQLEDGHGLGDVLRSSSVIGKDVASYVEQAEKRGNPLVATRELSALLLEQAKSAGEGLYLLLFPMAMTAVGLVVGALSLTLARSYVDLLRQVP